MDIDTVLHNNLVLNWRKMDVMDGHLLEKEFAEWLYSELRSVIQCPSGDR